jgi:hypothetical protein
MSPPRAHQKEHFEGQDEAAIPEDSAQEEKERAADVDGWNEDPANPRNWTVIRKWRNVAIVSFYTFITYVPFTYFHFESATQGLCQSFGIEYDGSWSTGDWGTLQYYESHNRRAHPQHIHPCLGYRSPLRRAAFRNLRPHMDSTHFEPLLPSILSGLHLRAHHRRINYLPIFRCAMHPFISSHSNHFAAGLGGCAPVAIGGGSISDLFNDKERGIAMSIYTTGPLMGPVLGPIAGGFMVQSIGFKWVFVLLTILAGVGALVGIPFLEETYAPVLKEKLARRRARDEEASGKGVSFEVPAKPSLGETLRVNLSRPFLLLTRSFICFILSLFMAL